MARETKDGWTAGVNSTSQVENLGKPIEKAARRVAFDLIEAMKTMALRKRSAERSVLLQVEMLGSIHSHLIDLV